MDPGLTLKKHQAETSFGNATHLLIYAAWWMLVLLKEMTKLSEGETLGENTENWMKMMGKLRFEWGKSSIKMAEIWRI